MKNNGIAYINKKILRKTSQVQFGSFDVGDTSDINLILYEIMLRVIFKDQLTDSVSSLQGCDKTRDTIYSVRSF